MGDMERLHRIKYLIQARQCVPLQDFLDELEVSKATFKRDLEYLRDRMNASIVYDRSMGGYRFENSNQDNKNNNRRNNTAFCVAHYHHYFQLARQRPTWRHSA